MAENIKYPEFFTIDMSEFYIHSGPGIRTTMLPRKTKNFVFFTG